MSSTASGDGDRAAARPRTAAYVAGALVLVVAAAAIVMSVARFGQVPAASTSRIEIAPSPNVILAVRDLARLETATYHMERVVELTDEQTRLFGLLEAKDALLLVAVGDVVAGVDLHRLRDEDVVSDWPNRQVKVRLPAPEIFSASLDNEKTHVVTRTTDTLANRREDLEGVARRDAESKMRGAAVEGGILDRAKASGEREIRSLLKSMGYAHVDIEWQ